MKSGNLISIFTILRNPTILVATILLFLNLALALWSVFIAKPKTERLQAAVGRQQELLEQRGKQAKSGNPKEQIYLTNEQLLKAFYANTPDHSELPALLEELFAYAKQLDLNIERINYNPERIKTADLVRYGLNFQLEGSYDQIKHMIFLLEQSPRTIALNRLQFQQRSGKSTNVVLGLDLDTYFERKGP